MKIKSLVISALLPFIIVILSYSDTFADKRKLWSQKCASCHDGKTAPNAESLTEKYKTVEEFIEAVKTKGHKGMNMLKGDSHLIKMVAKELGIRESKE